jgi:hypothetical protein
MLIIMSVAIVIPNPRRPRRHADRVRLMLARIHFEVVEMFAVGSI